MKKYLYLNIFFYLILYHLTQMLGFSLLPLIMNDTGNATLILIFILPALGSAALFIYGFTSRYTDILYCLTTAVAFLPAMFIYMGSVALVYALAYFVIATFFNAHGMLAAWKLGEKRKKETTP